MDLNAEKAGECPSRDQAFEQVNRIAGSSGFLGSESLRNLLLYLSRHAMEHPGETVKEYEIATQVLGRSPNFDPRVDSTVRALASRLRSKLAEYYLHEGSRDPVLVDLSKGNYALFFSFREKAPQTQYGHTEITVTKEPLKVATRRNFLVLAPLFVIGLIVVGGLAYLAGRRSTRVPVSASTQLFWGSFLKGGDPLIIFPNPTFRGLPETGMQLVEPDSLRTDGMLDVLTGTGETMALEALTRQILRLGHDSRAKRAHLFTWDDATNFNLIILGGQVQNAAFAQLPKLQRFNLKSPAEEPFLQQGAVHDGKPAAGGESYYLASKDLNNGNDYAIIALIDGVSPEHRILLLAGSNTYGTEGAANFLCDPDLLKGLLDRLDVRKGAPIPPFEAVIRVQVRGGAPISPQLVLVYKRQPEAGPAGASHS